MGFEHMIPASERAKTVHALDRSANVTGGHDIIRGNFHTKNQFMLLIYVVLALVISLLFHCKFSLSTDEYNLIKSNR
jgi:hypothetical protein